MCLEVYYRYAPAALARLDSKKQDAKDRIERAARSITINVGGGVTMEFVYIKPGRFARRGRLVLSPPSPTGQQHGGYLRHEVAISGAYHIGKHEVTQAQYERIMRKRPRIWNGPNCPAVVIPWGDAEEFCRRLSVRARRRFRLPTEAEWEYACRAGSTGEYCFGNDERWLGSFAWFKGNSGGESHPVGQKRPNAWGLYDMHGSVWEWCADWYGERYYEECPRDDPPGPPSGRFRIMRGGELERRPPVLFLCAPQRHRPHAASGQLLRRLPRGPRPKDALTVPSGATEPPTRLRSCI